MNPQIQNGQSSRQKYCSKVVENMHKFTISNMLNANGNYKEGRNLTIRELFKILQENGH